MSKTAYSPEECAFGKGKNQIISISNFKYNLQFVVNKNKKRDTQSAGGPWEAGQRNG